MGIWRIAQRSRPIVAQRTEMTGRPDGDDQPPHAPGHEQGKISKGERSLKRSSQAGSMNCGADGTIAHGAQVRADPGSPAAPGTRIRTAVARPPPPRPT